MVRTGERRARQRQGGHPHLRQALADRLEHRVERGQLRRQRPVAVRGGHFHQLAGLPHAFDGCCQGVDRAGEADHQQPGHGDDAEQVVQVQPAHAATAPHAHGGEIQLAHERRVEHHSADDREHQQQAHQAEKEHAWQAGEHVHVQPQQDVQDALGGLRHVQLVAIAQVEELVVEGGRVGQEAGRRGHHHQRLLVVEEQVRHHLAGPRRLGGGEDGVEARRRGAGGDLLQFGHARVVQFVAEDQRQPGQAEQQHEQRADQAAPLVQGVPETQGSGGHASSLRSRRSATASWCAAG
ncbi:hypothetical protein D3C76_652160 [compost metagenome]